MVDDEPNNLMTSTVKVLLHKVKQSNHKKANSAPTAETHPNSQWKSTVKPESSRPATYDKPQKEKEL